MGCCHSKKRPHPPLLHTVEPRGAAFALLKASSEQPGTAGDDVEGLPDKTPLLLRTSPERLLIVSADHDAVVMRDFDELRIRVRDQVAAALPPPRLGGYSCTRWEAMRDTDSAPTKWALADVNASYTLYTGNAPSYGVHAAAAAAVVHATVALAVRTDDDALLVRCMDVASRVCPPVDEWLRPDALLRARLEAALAQCDPRAFEFASVAEAWAASVLLATVR